MKIKKSYPLALLLTFVSIFFDTFLNIHTDCVLISHKLETDCAFYKVPKPRTYRPKYGHNIISADQIFDCVLHFIRTHCKRGGLNFNCILHYIIFVNEIVNVDVKPRGKNVQIDFTNNSN